MSDSDIDALYRRHIAYVIVGTIILIGAALVLPRCITSALDTLVHLFPA